MRLTRQRWLVVAALFTITFAVANPFAAFGVFLPVPAEEFGCSRGAISVALSINFLLGGAAGFLVGAMADRYGPRAILVVTVVLAGAGIALASTVRALWQLYLVIGVMGGIGVSAFYLGFAGSDTVFVRVIPDVFGLRALGAIMGVLSLGWRCGAALGPSLTGFMYDLTGSYALPFGTAPVATLISYGLYRIAAKGRRAGRSP